MISRGSFPPLIDPSMADAGQTPARSLSSLRSGTAAEGSPLPQPAGEVLEVESVGDTARLSAPRFLDRIAAWLRDFFGPVEFEIGDYCAMCDDVHAEGVRCPRAMTGRCMDCGNRWRALDRFGNCAKCGGASVTKRQLRWRR